ncbi:optic atrophy 3 protein-domain-containing protein [Coprinopsis sp. MPI-PUGE-AT-0042]|nr:optic atrophy 3 protein-domain-containing protein [Coprinopsis sp. MPI-PUGE-AT-0042]
MASVKLGTLLIRTLAKPISNKIKEQARVHPRFREMCIDLAQILYRSETKLRTNVLGEQLRGVSLRPLSETKAIDRGANFLAEGFMFSVAAALIIGETWRSSRSQSKRRDTVDDQLEELGEKVSELTARVDSLAGKWDDDLREQRVRNDELARILERGWAEFQDEPVQIPRVQLGSGSRTLQSPTEEADQIHTTNDLLPDETRIDFDSSNKPSDSSGGPSTST